MDGFGSICTKVSQIALCLISRATNLLPLIPLYQINPDYYLCDKVLIAGKVEERWSEMVSAEKDDMVGNAVELQAINLLTCQEAHQPPYKACPLIQ